jgi:hypothetical protein
MHNPLVLKISLFINHNQEAMITALVLALLLWAGSRQVRGIDAVTVYAGDRRELSVRSALAACEGDQPETTSGWIC